MPQQIDDALDELRLRLAPHIANAAIFDGWSHEAIKSAAATINTDPALAVYAFRDGPMAMIMAWIDTIDAKMAAELPYDALTELRVSEKISCLIWSRLEAALGKEEALRRALSIMAMPQNIRTTTRRSWKSADLMWRQAGDTATDYNYYTKRLILSGVYAATLSVFANDSTDDKIETRAFLDRRIAGILRFEKAKRQLTTSDGLYFSPARFLGRLRYPES